MKRRTVAVAALASAILAALAGCGGDDDPPPTCGGSGTAPNVAGIWQVHSPVVESTTCNEQQTANVVDILSDCAFAVSQSGFAVSIEDCTTAVFSGCVNNNGIITATYADTATFEGCTEAVQVDVEADARASQSVAGIVVSYAYTGDCGGFPNCKITLETDWDELVGGAALPQRSAEVGSYLDAGRSGPGDD